MFFPGLHCVWGSGSVGHFQVGVRLEMPAVCFKFSCQWEMMFGKWRTAWWFFFSKTVCGEVDIVLFYLIPSLWAQNSEEGFIWSLDSFSPVHSPPWTSEVLAFQYPFLTEAILVVVLEHGIRQQKRQFCFLGCLWSGRKEEIKASL